MGVPGLDDILGGGLTPQRLYLLEGAPGAGKTTLSIQFLREGVARGEGFVAISRLRRADAGNGPGQRTARL
ncbi:MAG: hypothetical protein EOP82_30545 [Variovorax sp.]|nr:MAG: hypothetical protein EOP82_30545 [Variovorax sp.]